MRILMVCLGNICRSPLAEGILRHKASRAGLDWQIDSAGTNGYHTGEAPHRLSQKVARLNGIEICDQRSRRFVAADMERYDRIYALATDVLDEIKLMSGNKYRPEKTMLLMDELHPDSNMDVPDPWYGEEPGYHDVYKMIDEVCEAIINRYGQKEQASASQQKTTS